MTVIMLNKVNVVIKGTRVGVYKYLRCATNAQRAVLLKKRNKSDITKPKQLSLDPNSLRQLIHI